MKIFKFGGASVKDAENIKNVANIIKSFENQNIVVVISAMGKMTNALEKLLNLYFEGEDYSIAIDEIKKYHFDILDDLFPKKETVFSEIEKIFQLLNAKLETEASIKYGFEYDQIIPFGEIISTKIVSEFLNYKKVKNKWLDIRKYLKTDSNHREANINWELSNKLITKKIDFINENLYIAQGFIGSDLNNLPTTLGREGSDFTASVLGNILNAEAVTVWKDVDGFFNIDPKIEKNATVLKEISYNEAIELAFYGAKIIHPKTINPLKIKQIPLYVKSFIDINIEGSVIWKNIEKRTNPEIPVFIFKENQILISISKHDYSFLTEKDLSEIFNLISSHSIKINLMENSALNFSICLDYDKYKTENFLSDLKEKYHIKYNKNLNLSTIRCYDESSINYVLSGKKIFVEQKSRYTARFITG